MKKKKLTNVENIDVNDEEFKTEIKETEEKQGLWGKLWRATLDPRLYGPESSDSSSSESSDSSEEDSSE